MKMCKKIVTLLLVAVLVVGLFSACAKDDRAVWEWDKLTREFISEANRNAPRIEEYYGTYNGWIVYGLYWYRWDGFDIPFNGDPYREEEIAGYHFISWPQIFVYRDGAYYSLKEAYEEHQILSKEQIGYINAFHRVLHPAEYEKKDEMIAAKGE